MEDLNDKIALQKLQPEEWNQVPSEIQNVIEGTGQGLTNLDLNQLGKGIADYVGNSNFYSDGAAAPGVYSLTHFGSKQTVTAYTEGLTAEFIPVLTNTGPSTASIASLGSQNIFNHDGGSLSGGEIVSGRRIVLKYDGTNFLIDIGAGTLKSVQTFTASGTWTKPAGINLIRVKLVGGGAGGGENASSSNSAGGGGAGGYAEGLIDASALTRETVTIGAGGAGAVATGNGSNGGMTSLGSLISATGGGGGIGEGIGGTGGNGTGGDINLKGGEGSSGDEGNASEESSGGSGGASYFGGGGAGGEGSVSGRDGSALGSGGGGEGLLLVAGGDGAAGFVVVWEYT